MLLVGMTKTNTLLFLHAKMCFVTADLAICHCTGVLRYVPLNCCDKGETRLMSRCRAIAGTCLNAVYTDMDNNSFGYISHKHVSFVC